MSQFMLAQGLKTSSLPQWIKVVPAVEDEFLRIAGAQIFGEERAGDSVTVLVENEDFDAVFLKAQREMIDGVAFEDTKLNDLLATLCRHAERVALWYGSDYGDLETVADAESLIRLVNEGLSSPSVEAYALFVRQ